MLYSADKEKVLDTTIFIIFYIKINCYYLVDISDICHTEQQHMPHIYISFIP